jgi:hypothetical protein
VGIPHANIHRLRARFRRDCANLSGTSGDLDWSFHTMTAFASGPSKNALLALVDLEIIDLTDDWMDRLPGPEQTRGSLVPEEQED